MPGTTLMNTGGSAMISASASTTSGGTTTSNVSGASMSYKGAAGTSKIIVYSSTRYTGGGLSASIAGRTILSHAFASEPQRPVAVSPSMSLRVRSTFPHSISPSSSCWPTPSSHVSLRSVRLNLIGASRSRVSRMLLAFVPRMGPVMVAKPGIAWMRIEGVATIVWFEASVPTGMVAVMVSGTLIW